LEKKVAITPLVIIGAGGFGREAHDVMEASNDLSLTVGNSYKFLGFIDDGDVNEALLEDRGPLLGGREVLSTLPAETRYVIGIGTGPVRREIDIEATQLGLRPATLIHPSAAIGRHRNRIGPGSIICSNCSVTTNVDLGRHTHLNLNSTVGHDAVFGDYVTLNPGVTISGNVTLEDEVNVGTNATVIQGKTVGRGSVIGAGASVIKDIPPDVVAVGVPARPR
jgi:sugar O-acyltransferase (sialic acid O-acetyltransferase NeuD family)